MKLINYLVPLSNKEWSFAALNTCKFNSAIYSSIWIQHLPFDVAWATTWDWRDW